MSHPGGTSYTDTAPSTDVTSVRVFPMSTSDTVTRRTSTRDPQYRHRWWEVIESVLVAHLDVKPSTISV